MYVKHKSKKERKFHNFILKYTLFLNFDAECMNYL